MVCSSCGWATQGGARFCEACGASLAARPAEAAVARKVVSIVFADLIGSTALRERLDPESVSRIMEGYHAAVRAAVEVQRCFREFLGGHLELAGRVGLRVAVNTGEVVVSDDYTAGIGDPLNVAARLQQEAKDGDVLIGESTQRLVAEPRPRAPEGTCHNVHTRTLSQNPP